MPRRSKSPAKVCLRQLSQNLPPFVSLAEIQICAAKTDSVACFRLHRDGLLQLGSRVGVSSEFAVQTPQIAVRDAVFRIDFDLLLKG
jgi:hypothetical protein